ncbi:alpha/beta hydrolase family domain-containing protein [Rhizoctonia solani AG-1 IA]|uniref:Alpha/beta hydrolase family domain-containing protein n=1 Tax=Thanatephorus cucumeris (strain AG1-IA) TaxID=983506 RepID=L8X3S4_THACA|nr:alpha/beta hydrolase family domain-containing protein [Rhizoctonia solani AG-1 IA]
MPGPLGNRCLWIPISLLQSGTMPVDSPRRKTGLINIRLAAMILITKLQLKSPANLSELGRIKRSKVAHLSTGHHYRYVDIQPPKGVTTIVTALLLHGFPDSAYGWRHQVKGWSGRGIRLIIPDMLGYHGSSQPTDPEHYAMKRLSDDLEELIRKAGVPEGEKIIVIAHDWGAGVANRLIQFKPELVKGAANFCIPFMPPSTQYIPLEKYIELLPSFQYQAFFASLECAAVLDDNQVATSECPSFEKNGVVEAWLKDNTQNVTSELLSKEELDIIVSEIKAGVGFGAMLNYYRTRKINHELEKDLPQDIRPDIPKLMIIPSADPAIPPAISINAEKKLKNHEIVWIEGLCGHWVQLEKPEESERIVGEWVERFAAKDWVP